MSSQMVDSLDILPEVAKKLKNAGVVRLTDIILQSTAELYKKTKIAENQLENIKREAARHIYPIHSLTAYDKLLEVREKITTGCESIDNLLQGGLLCQGITEITGESTAGKTQICMQLALTSQLIKRAGKHCSNLYICTEDVFPTQRLVQLEQAMRRKYPAMYRHRFTDHVFIEHLSDKNQLLATLQNRVPTLLEKGQTNLIIIDSVTAVFRGQDECQSMMSRSKDLAGIALSLHTLAEKYKICIVCVNQVTADMRSDSLESSQPALGLTWSNLITARLQVKRYSYESAMRVMTVNFAPHLPTDYCAYTITKDGVVPSASLGQ